MRMKALERAASTATEVALTKFVRNKDYISMFIEVPKTDRELCLFEHGNTDRIMMIFQ